MNVSELDAELSNFITSCQIESSATARLKYINQGLTFVTGLVNLRPLQTSGTVTISANNATGTLPTNKHDNDPFLVELDDSDETKLTKYDTMAALRRNSRGNTSTGDPTKWFAAGSTIHVHPTPSTNTDLTVYYYKKPTTLSVSSDVPEGIPLALHSLILTHYAAAMIFSLNDDKKNANYHQNLFSAGMEQLKTFAVPDEDDIEYVTDNMDHIDDY